jgi:hypothetical protein
MPSGASGLVEKLSIIPRSGGALGFTYIPPKTEDRWVGERRYAGVQPSGMEVALRGVLGSLRTSLHTNRQLLGEWLRRMSQT